MDSTILLVVGQIAGVAGIALGVFLFLFKDLLKKLKIPGLSQHQWYRVVIIFMVLVWSVAVLGVGAWVYSTRVTGDNEPTLRPTDPFIVWRVDRAKKGWEVNSFEFQVNDIEKVRDPDVFISDLVEKLPSASDNSPTEFLVFRSNDEARIDRGADPLYKSNAAAFLIPPGFVEESGSEHIAFRRVKSMADSMSK